MIRRIFENAYQGLLVAWKFILSFRKRDWSLTDYPVVVRKLRGKSESWGKTIRWTLPAYDARIVNWSITGSGDTRADAIESLRERVGNIRNQRGSLPRPGRRLPLELVSQDRVAPNADLAEQFLESVLGIKQAWISDESSLWHFTFGDSLDEYYQKIQSIYGVDASDIPDANIAAILERITHTRQEQPSEPL